MSDFNRGYARSIPADRADMSVDAGLRSFMLGVYNKVALGLVVSAALAYLTGQFAPVRDLMYTVTPDGRLAGKGGKRGFLSADGRVAAFMTPARFSKQDRDNNSDVYVRQLKTGRTVWASPDGPGASRARAGIARSASISGDGRYVVLNSQATSLAKGDTDDRYDTFVRDMVAKRSVLVSVGADGSSGPGNAYGGAISRDGTCVAFTAAARSNLVPEDTNHAWDIYVRVRFAG